MSEPTPIRAIIYARVAAKSFFNVNPEWALAGQLGACREYIEENGYFLVGDHFVCPTNGQEVDPTTPGAIAAYIDISNSIGLGLPGMEAGLDYYQRKNVDRLIIYDWDCLGEHLLINIMVREQLAARGVHCEAVLRQFGESERQLHKELRKGFEQLMLRLRSRQMLRFKEQVARRGRFVGSRPPFGYRRSRVAACGLKIDEDAAAIVRRIFSLHLDSALSHKEIANVLNADNISSPSGRPWSRSLVGKILRNETYTGTLYYGKTRVVHDSNGRTQKPRDKSEWIAIPVPQIISREMFEAAQTRSRY